MRFVEQAPSLHSLPYPKLVDGTEAFAGKLIERLHYGDAGSSLIHAIGCYEADELLVTGVGHLFYRGHLLNEAQFMPKYWKDEIDSGIIDLEREKRLPVRKVCDPVIVFMSRGQYVYGHVILEMLPRAMLISKTLNKPTTDFHYLINIDTPMWVINIIKLSLGIKDENLSHYDGRVESVMLSRAIIPTFVTTSNEIHPNAGFLYDDLGDRAQDGSASDLKLVFISRAGHERDSVNSRLLEKCARDEFGFSVIHPENLSFSEQVAIFRNAEVVAGLAGSGLHTALFSRPLVTIASMGFLNGIQSAIAALKNLKQSYLSCDYRYGSRGTIDLVEFCAWMRKIL